MGLKRGSSGDPFEDDAVDDEQDDVQEMGDELPSEESEAMTETESTVETPQRTASIPYIFRRKKVNDGREQIPFFMRDFVMAAEPDFRRAVQEELGENVPKSDLREAAYIVAQRHEQEVVDELRSWGYDYEE